MYRKPKPWKKYLQQGKLTCETLPQPVNLYIYGICYISCYVIINHAITLIIEVRSDSTYIKLHLKIVFFSCQNSMTYFLPGSIRNKFSTSNYALNQHSFMTEAIQKQLQNLEFHFSYFKICEFIIGIFALCFSFIFNLWNIMEGKVVANFTLEFRNKMLTELNLKGTQTEAEKIDDPRDRHLNYFIKFFNDFQHFKAYGIKYLSIYILAIVTHTLLFIYYSWLLFEEMSKMFSPTSYTTLIDLAFQDDFQQLRTDRLAVLFPDFFGCLIPITGQSGSIFNTTVICASYTNGCTKKIHVFALIFSCFMLICLLLDCVWFFWAIQNVPYTKSYGNHQMEHFLIKFGFGKRILLLLFEKNLESLFWDEMLSGLFKVNKGKVCKSNGTQRNQVKTKKETLLKNRQKPRNLEDTIQHYNSM